MCLHTVVQKRTCTESPRVACKLNQACFKNPVPTQFSCIAEIEKLGAGSSIKQSTYRNVVQAVSIHKILTFRSGTTFSVWELN